MLLWIKAKISSQSSSIFWSHSKRYEMNSQKARKKLVHFHSFEKTAKKAPFHAKKVSKSSQNIQFFKIRKNMLKFKDNLWYNFILVLIKRGKQKSGNFDSLYFLTNKSR